MSKKNKKDVVFLCQYFYPEYISSAKLPFDIASYLAEQGYSVGALCGYPFEYSYTRDVPKKETVNGVLIKRVHYIFANRKNFLGRVINAFSFTSHALVNVGFLRKYRCAVVISDPPVLPIVAAFAKKLFKTKMVFISYDIFPEIAIALGAIKPHGSFSKLMLLFNRHFHKHVDGVVALTDQMKEFIVETRTDVDPDVITVIPNWSTDTVERFVGRSCCEWFDLRDGQFVVSYFGNMGTCQDIHTLLEAAKLLKDRKDISFLFAGHGNKLHDALNYIIDNELQNVRIHEFLYSDDYKAALTISSCCVVSLNKGLNGTCAPSKYYSYLKIGCAVAAVCESTCYLAKEVEDERIGFTVEPGESEKLADKLVYCAEHREEVEQMGKNAKQLYDTAYAKQLGVEKYRAYIGGIINKEEA